MNLFVSIAQENELHEAETLLHDVYKEEFDLDFDCFDRVFPLEFPREVLLIRNEDGQLVATASFMQSVEGLFPSEYYFGARIQQQASQFSMASTVEVGRLAKRGDFKDSVIASTVMLATNDYLKYRGYENWLATVKPLLYSRLARTGLEMVPFELGPEKTGAQAECVSRYKGNSISVFRASAQSTAAAFEPIRHTLVNHSVELTF